MKYEYKVGRLAFDYKVPGNEPERILNNIGEQGWNLVAIQDVDLLIFVRPKVEAVTIE